MNSTHPVIQPTQRTSSKTNDWILFIVCLVFGGLGIHKFVEGRIGMGILYLFTAGLFYIGWIVDIVNYLKRALN